MIMMIIKMIMMIFIKVLMVINYGHIKKVIQD